MKEFDGKQFRNLELAGEVFSDLSFCDCAFVGCTVEGCRFVNCAFSDCVFTGCRFTTNKGAASEMRSSVFEGCALSGVDWVEWTSDSRYFLPFSSFAGCRLRYNNFVELNLNRFTFSGNDVTDSFFSECRLCSSVFSGCNLSKTEFFRCDLSGAEFGEAVGYRVDIITNKVKGAHFTLPDALGLLRGLDIKID